MLCIINLILKSGLKIMLLTNVSHIFIIKISMKNMAYGKISMSKPFKAVV